jgi:hypothetical protein
MKRIWVVFLCISFLNFQFNEASAAALSPKLVVDCFANKTSGSDYRGDYVEYNPTLGAYFNGKTASIRVYVNNSQTSTVKLSRSSSSYGVLTSFTAPIKFYKNEISYGKNTFKYSVQDSKGNKHSWTCETTLSESSFNSVSAGIGSGLWNSGLSGCTYRGKKLYGSVYFTNSSYSADFSVYVSSSSYSADLNVYLASSSYSANSCGIWYPTSSSYSADFTVYLTSSSYSADFSIYRTSSSYSAGAN